MREVFHREINASEACVFFHVANDVRQLKRHSDLLSQLLSRLIAISEDTDAHQSYYRRHVIAVTVEFVESAISNDRIGRSSQRNVVAHVHQRSGHKLVEQ